MYVFFLLMAIIVLFTISFAFQADPLKATKKETERMKERTKEMKAETERLKNRKK